MLTQIFMGDFWLFTLCEQCIHNFKLGFDEDSQNQSSQCKHEFDSETCSIHTFITQQPCCTPFKILNMYLCDLHKYFNQIAVNTIFWEISRQ